MDKATVKQLIDNDFYYMIALLIVCMNSFGVGLIIGYLL